MSDYYDRGGISAIEILKAKLTPEQFEGFLLGNVIKYSLQLNWKGQPESDARKLSTYANWLKELRGK